MKKSLALLLALILCLGLFVACDGEEKTLEIDTLKNATARYYYNETVYFE